jgi:type I site-specific restriction endonuclease
MVLRIRQPLLSEPPPGGAVNALLAAATLSSAGTLAAGASGTLTRTLGTATLVSNGSQTASNVGILTKTLDAATLTAGDGIRQQIYQEIWIIEEKKPKKRIKRTQRRAKKAIQEVDDELELAYQKARQGELKASQLQNLNTVLTQHLDLISLEYGKIEAELKLNRAISEAKAQAERELKRKLEELAAIQAAAEEERRKQEEERRQRELAEYEERARKEKQELEDLGMLLDYLVKTGGAIPEVVKREIVNQEYPPGYKAKKRRRIGKILKDTEGTASFIIDEIEELLDEGN